MSLLLPAGLVHKFLAAKEIHRGLTVQRCNLLEVQSDLVAMGLLEEIRDPWLKVGLELSELESFIVLKMRGFFCIRSRQVGFGLFELIDSAF